MDNDELLMKIASNTSHEIVIEKSRFICYLFRIDNEREIKELINLLKKEHQNANHVCSAAVCYENNRFQRSNDDGEPKGTAGAPMLNVLNMSGMNDTLAVVVRYFGGIKLGAGGLIRAYSKAVSECLKQANLVEIVKTNKYHVKVNYELNNKVENLLRKKALNFTVDYDLDVTYTYLADDSLELDLLELSSGQIKPKFIETIDLEKEISL